MRPWSLVLVLQLVAAPAFAGRTVVDGIAAIVNADLVLTSEWSAAVAQAEAAELVRLPADQHEQARVEIRREVLDALIDQRIVEQAMNRADLVVEDREIEQAIADVARQNRITPEVLFEEVGRQGLSPDGYRDEIRKQIRQYKFMNLEIRGRVSIDDAQLRAAWTELRAQTPPDPAWRLQRVFVPHGAGPDGAMRAAQEAEGLLAEVAAGRTFDDVVTARLADPASAPLSGTGEPIRPADLSESFVGPLRAAPEGSVVRVESPRGIFLLRIAEVVDVSLPDFESMRDELTNAVYERRMDQELEAWTREERSKGHVEIRVSVLEGPKAG